MDKNQRKRILFFAEAVTLAHVARPLVLAECLDPGQYEVHFASAPRFEFAFEKTNFRRWKIDSISCEQFLRALAYGSRLYDFATLQKYVEDDLRIIGEIQPDLIVGDFRLSLAVSTEIARVKYAAIANAYWSPYTKRKLFPLPDVPASRVLGYSLTNALFHLLQPLIFAYHARPLNKLRKQYGLRELDNLLHVYTRGDYTLYADPPGFYATSDLPPNHRYLGPIFWSPEIPSPAWWTQLDQKPVIYINLGSSGPTHLLPRLAEVFTCAPITVLMATAGRWNPTSLSTNIHASDYLPGEAAVARASLVVCNGGSPSVYQALKHGVPVIGITANMDQMLCMSGVERLGAGILLHPRQVTEESIRVASSKLLDDAGYKRSAEAAMRLLAFSEALSNFQAFLMEAI